MDSVHWDWGKGYCRKHLGNGVPCQVCITTNDSGLERTAEEWTALVGENPCKELTDTCSFRPVGEPIKGSWSPGGVVNAQNVKKEIFRVETLDSNGNVIAWVESENVINEDDIERILNINFADPVINAEEANLLPNVTDCDQPFVRLKEPLTLHDGDTLQVRHTVSEKKLPLAERLALLAEQHRQRFVEAGIEDPDELLKMLGAEELISPTIPGFELPKHLPSRVPVDIDLIHTIIEAEDYSDELRATLMSQIAVYGAPTICGLLAQAGVDESFIDSLTSNLQQG